MKYLLSIIILFASISLSCNSKDYQKNANEDKLSNSDLFARYYSNAIVDQSRGGEVEEAIIKFQENDFTKATPLFKSIITKDSSNIAVWFYYGVSNIEISDYDNSIKAFKKIITDSDNLYVEHAEWYLGLCYLKANRTKCAIYEFTKIAADTTNFHHADAVAILSQISHPVGTLNDLLSTENVLKQQNAKIDYLLALRK